MKDQDIRQETVLEAQQEHIRQGTGITVNAAKQTLEFEENNEIGDGQEEKCVELLEFNDIASEKAMKDQDKEQETVLETQQKHNIKATGTTVNTAKLQKLEFEENNEIENGQEERSVALLETEASLEIEETLEIEEKNEIKNEQEEKSVEIEETLEIGKYNEIKNGQEEKSVEIEESLEIGENNEIKNGQEEKSLELLQREEEKLLKRQPSLESPPGELLKRQPWLESPPGDLLQRQASLEAPPGELLKRQPWLESPPGDLLQRQASLEAPPGELLKRQPWLESPPGDLLQRQASLEAAPDGGWGWVLVVATGLGLSVSAGFNKSISLFYQQLLERFGQSAALTAGTTSLAGTLRMVLSPFVSALCNKTSHRTVGILGGALASAGCMLTAFMPSLPWVYVTYSVLQGIGTCMFMVPTLSVVNMYFTKNRGKANSLRSCFAGIGGLYMTQLLSLLFVEFGFSGAILIVGALLLHLIPAAGFLRPLRKQRRRSIILVMDEDVEEAMSKIKMQASAPGETTANGISNGCNENNCTVEDTLIVNQENTEEQLVDMPKNRHCNMLRTCFVNGSRKCVRVFGLDAFRNPSFCVLALLMSSFNMAVSLNTSLLAGLALEKGYSKTQVTLLMSLNFAMEIPFRLLSGVFFDLPMIRYRRLPVFDILSICIGVTVLCQPFLPLLIPSMAFWMLQNGLIGVFGSQAATVMSDIVPRSTITSTLGLMRLVQGIGNLIGPFLGGFLRDVTGSYIYGYIVAGSQLSVISISLFIMSICRTKNKDLSDKL